MRDPTQIAKHRAKLAAIIRQSGGSCKPFFVSTKALFWKGDQGLEVRVQSGAYPVLLHDVWRADAIGVGAEGHSTWLSGKEARREDGCGGSCV